MKLDAWLKQDRPLDERLRVIERLCQAVNEIHDRGDSVGGLEPGRVEIGDEAVCDLSAARKGKPRPPYVRADETGSPSQADIYAAGAIAWEILADRPAGKALPHLAEVRPDLQRELSDAIMACLEESPDWRPNDLTYLAQMAAVRQRATAAGTPRASRAPLPPRSTPQPTPRRGPSRRTWPLLLALVVVLGLAALAGRQYLGIGATDAPEAPAATPAAPAPAATAAPAPAPPPRSRVASRGGATSTAPPSGTAASDPAPESPAPALPAAAESAPVPPGTDSPPSEAEAPLETAPPLPVSAPAAAPPTTTAPVTRPPVSTPPAPGPPAPAAQAAPVPAAPAVLSAVAPPTIKRPGKVLVDLRGTGLHSRHQARILPLKKVPWGIKVVRQKLMNETLITILLELEASAEPGEYAITVEDDQGNRSEPLVFTVTK